MDQRLTSQIDLRVVGPAENVSADADVFLDGLVGPTIFRLPGRDRTRTRVVSGSLHGNEPSGLRAIHAFLVSGETPAVESWFFLGAVEAARTAPRWTRRMLPGRRDLNRCFRPPFDDVDGSIARQALDILVGAHPEAVVDLHNNSGHNPAYAIGSFRDPQRLMLASMFANRYVTSRLSLGTLMEAFDELAPAISVECGAGGDPAADSVAAAGLARFLRRDRIEPVFVSAEPMSILTDPVRVRARAGVTLAFADQGRTVADGPVDLTLDREIERHNFQTLAPGTVLGWLRPGAPWPLEATDESGREVSAELFGVVGGALVTTTSIVPIMLTTDAASALGDCLFYAVHQRQ